MSQELKTFFDTLTTLVVVTVVILSFFYTIHFFVTENKMYISTEGGDVSARTAPVGRVRVAGQTGMDETAAMTTETVALSGSETSAAPQSSQNTGQRVYNSLCFTCHGSESGAGGLPNIPHFGDAAAWSGRIAQGSALLYERALNGFTGNSGIPMPARGGNPNLSDDEIRAAVDFIVEHSQ